MNIGGTINDPVGRASVYAIMASINKSWEAALWPSQLRATTALLRPSETTRLAQGKGSEGVNGSD